MSAPVERVLDALREQGIEARRSGSGWSACCPAHEDRNPSLSIGVGDDGRVLVHCHAGCATRAVLEALGLRECDLFADDPGRRDGRAPTPRRRVPVTKTPRRGAARGGFGDGDTNSKPSGRLFPAARDAVRALEATLGTRSKTWTYHNADGEPVGLVVRWDRADGSKDIRPIARLADRLWGVCAMPEPRPLYCLPELLASGPDQSVFVVEGEKCADALAGVGFVVTTSAGGSKAAAKTDWSPLRGREVVILADHDEAGDAYAEEVASCAHAAGASDIRVLRTGDLWPGCPEGGDIADLLGEDGPWRTRDDADIREGLLQAAEAVEPWRPEPGPEPLRWCPFPVEALPEPLRSFVTRASSAMGCDEAFVALPLLAGLASAIGNARTIRLKAGWEEPAILWTAIVGESGTMKTPAMHAALEPLHEAQRRAFAEHAEAMGEYEDELTRWQAEMAAWRKSTGRLGNPPTRPETPVCRRSLVSDTTVEALAPILLQNPRGVLLARDELAGWLGSFDQYKKGSRAGADCAHWLTMHNAQALTVDRKTGTPPTIHVPRASVSVTGGIQPGTLRRALGIEHLENGLAPRLLLAMPPRRPRRWTEAEVDDDLRTRMDTVFQRLLNLAMDTDARGIPRPRSIPLRDEARRRWIAFYNEHAEEQADLSGVEASIWSKLEAAAARLALVIHCVRHAAGDATLTDPDRIDTPSIEAGVRLARWFAGEARRVLGTLDENDKDDERRRLIEWIEARGGSVTVRDLTHGLRAFRGDADSARRALDALAEAGDGRWERQPRDTHGGRPTARFTLGNPATVTKTPSGGAENRGFGDGDTTTTPENTQASPPAPRLVLNKKPTDESGMESLDPDPESPSHGLESILSGSGANGAALTNTQPSPHKFPVSPTWSDGSPIPDEPPPGPEPIEDEGGSTSGSTGAVTGSHRISQRTEKPQKQGVFEALWHGV